MARATAKRRKYTDEERSARARADRELLDRADEALSNDEQVADFARRAIAGMGLSVLRYSLRNQMLLDTQAAERGIELTAVATFQGWLKLGRCVRKGQRGMRIIRPVGLKDEKDGEDADAPDEDKPRRAAFRAMTVFDLSQTDAVEGYEPEPDGDDDVCLACGSTEHETAACQTEPAEVMYNRLYEQITDAGYRVDWPADIPDLVSVDHGERVVYAAMAATADNPDAVAQFAVALARIVTRAREERESKRAARAALPG